MGWSRDTIRRVAKRTGYPVVEAWSSHNKGSMGTIYGPMLHHTGTPETASGDYPTLRIVRDGRPGLENSLCMFGLGRSGTIYLVNQNVSWHSGAGNWNGVTDGNGHFAGIEAEGPYRGAWPAAELDSYQRLVASILLETGRDTNWMPRHAEFARPAGRKVDTSNINMTEFKGAVRYYLQNPDKITKGNKPTVKEEEDLTDEQAKQLAAVYNAISQPVINGVTLAQSQRNVANAVSELVGHARETVQKLRTLDLTAELSDADVAALADAVAAKVSADQADTFLNAFHARLSS